jgi:hypothetical protein
VDGEIGPRGRFGALARAWRFLEQTLMVNDGEKTKKQERDWGLQTDGGTGSPLSTTKG